MAGEVEWMRMSGQGLEKQKGQRHFKGCQPMQREKPETDMTQSVHSDKVMFHAGKPGGASRGAQRAGAVFLLVPPRASVTAGEKTLTL